MAYYKCDDHFSRHMEEAATDGRVYATILAKVTHEYVFMRSDEENVDFALGVHGDEFDYIIKDIEHEGQFVIAEGCSLLPQKVSGLNVSKNNIVYLVPTEDFHRAKYKDRTWAWDRLQETSNPAQAYENWMKRDALMAREIYTSAIRHGFWCVQVDGSTDFELLYQMIVQRVAYAQG